ncbi:MAG: PorT family protein [Bdellovibrionaceae bacterium]|nr:PorT family protein [Pseudobdellovibrionaceae bacterium]
MKNIFFLIVLNAVLPLNIYSQTNKLDIGVIGGVARITLRGNEIMDNNHRPAFGFIAGLSAQYNWKTVSLVTNVLLERKGSVIAMPLTDANGNQIGSYNLTNALDYITLPLMIRKSFGNKIKFFANAGSYVAYLRAAEYRNSLVLIQSNKAFFKKEDVGLCFGIGLSFPLSNSMGFTAEIRNNLGLINISDVPVNNNVTIKTNSSALLLSFFYRFGRPYESTTDGY